MKSYAKLLLQDFNIQNVAVAGVICEYPHTAITKVYHDSETQMHQSWVGNAPVYDIAASTTCARMAFISVCVQQHPLLICCYSR